MASPARRRATPAPTESRAPAPAAGPEVVHVDLALQGGGSHGAFTWGVLDRFLEEPRLAFDGISGTSAGAMNAAVMASGYAKGGREGARAALEGFWKRNSQAAAFSPFQRTPLDKAAGRWTLDNSPVFLALDLASRMFSPYDFGPLTATNPLEAVLAESVDFDALAAGPIRVFVTATNVRTGRGRVFRNAEITPRVLLASACLPTMFQAVEIDGEPYWDGGYSGNPTITPLVVECQASDTIIVPINPVQRPGTPTSAREIMNRLNEVSFNAVLLKELRMIALLHQMAEQAPADIEGEAAIWAKMRVHYVRNDVMTTLGYSSKLNAEWAFLTMLRDEGRKAADAFLAEHGDSLGRRSTLPFELMRGDS
ncbi:MAG: patatin-like phospholipase family protein [Rubritepida sp.]|jgi:NTE family protein|nr:patatin-like phospholipase family protein [Rubritepida sp.]MCU0944239.1 patatin-like phospholipase family protein [Rubritepida sp.]